MIQALNPGAPAKPDQDPAQARPNLADPAAAEARFLARQPIYRRLAHHTIDTSSLTTEQTVAALLARLHASRSRRR
jgi:shikimate kinase